jgi:hypothetical protein
VKRYWEIIADNLSKAEWSWGCVAARGFSRANNLDSLTRIAANGKRFVVRADERLAAFVEL